MLEKIEGIVISVISGYYDVETEKGAIRSRARGVFRNRQQKPLVGDHVIVQVDDHGMNYLVEILPRKNEIGRPAVANVDQVLLVISAVEPDFSLELLDRYLTFFAWKNIGVTIYLSKTDITPTERLAKIKDQLAYYQKIGYRVFTNQNELEKQLPELIKKNAIWTLAGQSGAGKSTLLNHLEKDANQATGKISYALNRGKHTTRQVQLFKYGKGYIADTPGFSAVDLYKIKLDELANDFYEFKKASAKCKFRSCQHLQEPKCEVKRLVKEGEIAQSRYDDYLKIRQEIQDKRMPDYLK
ncbi:ribosome small subunit-dependent GTPase A [Lactobacillus sp. PV034]|uniref:ribosome small subunit-dependent GTPase A n=1 Tax=Lactobacillus sp. PV034 TaxID=2594495 RepID=UPI00223FB982|nr:ribosome small subunit-dependent GTPase A [Lactobacillus sp. PV034]QNQ80273.1 ribosome small subunit-dependent GTPase A [Lactobacillus sp. PV034]